MGAEPKVVVVMPAYNAAKTLHMTYADLPHQIVDLVILVDDGSKDETARIAKELGLELFVHNRNYGYGANQKTCYREALKAGADIVVMVHPDYQYDPTLLPQIIGPIAVGNADVVLGSRLLGADPLAQGMPWWKYYANLFLTGLDHGANRADQNADRRGPRAYALFRASLLGVIRPEPGLRTVDLMGSGKVSYTPLRLAAPEAV
jgi:glycosyltransferase involved in cell wall biosynthesis